MKTLRTFLSSLVIVGLSGFSMPSFADDTELYTQGAAVVADASVRPNILLIMDNSGSMKDPMPALTEIQAEKAAACLNDDEVDKVKSGVGTRMMVLKAALCQVLDEVSNANIGLERFTFDTSEGSNTPILYPVTNINSLVDKNVESYDIPIRSSSDDAEEGNAAENVVLNDRVIEATKRIGSDVLSEATTTSLRIKVAADGDDARESLGNKATAGTVVSTTKKDLALGATNTDGEQIVGLRFTDVQIPTGATILASWIEFTAFNVDCQCNQSVSIKIKGFDSTNVNAFSETSKDISNRPLLTMDVNWKNIEPWDDKKVYSTPDLSEIIQGVITKSGWNSGQAIGFSFIRDPRYTSDTPDNASDSNRRFYGAGEATESISAPVLKVFYSTKSGYSVGEAASFAKTFPTGLKRVSQQITNNDNDAYEFLSSGTRTCTIGGVVKNIMNSSNKYTMMALGTGRPNSTSNYGNELIGLRFNNLAIPKGAIITSAKLTLNFWAKTSEVKTDVSAEALNMDIFAENNVNATSFAGGTNFNTTCSASNIPKTELISKRTLSTEKVSWDVPPWSADLKVDTPDITKLITPIVTDPSWNSNSNALVFLLKPNSVGNTASRRIYDYSDSVGVDANNNRAAKLDITYVMTEEEAKAIATPPPKIEAATQEVGFRFQGVNIPRGAMVKTAFIKFTSGMKNDSSAEFRIYGEKIGNSDTFKAKPKDISNRSSRTTNYAVWGSSRSGTSKLTTWETGQVYSTPELKAIVQEIVNQSDWCGGNAMSFFVKENSTTKTSLRNIMSFDESPSSAPILHVEFLPQTIDYTNTCMQQTVSVGITNALDDGVETAKRDGYSDNTVFLTGSNDDAILNMANTQKTTGSHTKRIVGVRFRGLPIKKGATIKFAKLEFTGLDLGKSENENMESDENTTFTKDSVGKPASLKIQAEMGNSLPFTETPKNFSSRIAQAPSVDWPISNKWVSYESYNSPDITTLVQAIVSSASWETNGDMAFFVSANDDISLRKAIAFEKSSTLNTRLVISVDTPLDSGGFKRPLKEYFKEEIRNMKPLGWTPTVDALYEGALYYRGGRVSGGATNRRGRHEHRVSHPLSHTSPIAYSNSSHYDTTVTPPEPKCIPGISAYPFSTVCSTEYLVDALTNPQNSSFPRGNEPPSYKSPIGDSLCQVNHIILLSDGEPTQNNVAGIVIGRGTAAKPTKTYNPPCGSSGSTACKNYIDEMYDADDAGMATMTCAPGDKKFNYDGRDRGKCGPEVAKFLADNPQKTGAPNSTVKTHTIGMKLDTLNGENYLKKIAAEGKGGYYRGNSLEELLLAFRTIISSAMSDTSSFASPAISVNVFNRLYHNNEIYFTFFKPNKKVMWEGNVKRYNLCSAKTGCASSIVGKGGTAAVGSDGGILNTAQDVWSTLTEADGPKVTMAGAGGVLPAPNNRNIYSNVVGDAAIALTDAVNAVKTTNSSLTEAMLNVATETNPSTARNEVINWIRGYTDATAGTLREWRFGDPLHSTPGVFTYGKETDGTPKTKVIVNTNEGAIRMLDGKTGVEDWMFIPRDMLAIQKDLKDNPTAAQRKYGIDGRPVVWTRDNNYNGIIDGSDSVWVFTGMRRGGRNIYALQVTPDTSNPPAHKPRLAWTIFGGQTSDQGDFSKLGQTWSTPIVTKVLYNGMPKQVLLFAGGFDATTQDVTANYQQQATMGNTIYMVDPLDGGKLLWSAGSTSNSSANLKLTGMNYSFPSDLTVIDGDGDGLMDRIYVGDTGGQVWRIDIRDVGRGYAVGGRLANLGNSTSDADKRRFFYPPDVARLTDTKYSPYAQDFDLVLIGSGHRPNPLNKTIQDRLYAFRDRQIGWLVGDANGGKGGNAVQDTPAFLDQTVAGGSSPAVTKFFTITEDKLYDATTEVLNNTTTEITTLDCAKAAIQKSLGWKVELATLGDGGAKNFIGEKALAKPLVLNGIAYYTTFVPPQPKADTSQILTVDEACKGTFDPGKAKAYAINILTGEGGLPNKKRAEEIGGGIPAEPIAVFTENGITVYASVGSGKVDDPTSPPALKVIGPNGALPRETVYWVEE